MVASHSKKESSHRSKQFYWQNVFACFSMSFEGILFFGTILGWPNLTEIFKKIGVYENLCSLNDVQTVVVNGTVNCPERDVIFTAAGTLGNVSMNMSCFIFGNILDKYGTFICRSFCTIMISIGLLCLMFTEDVHWLLFPGVLFFSSGTFSLCITNLPLSALFPSIAGIILVCADTMFSVSTMVFRAWSALFETGISLKWIVALMLFLTAIIWIRTLFIMPVGWVDQKSNIYHLSPIYCRFQIKKASRQQSVVNQYIPEDALFKTFKQAVRSPQFILLCLWESFSDMNIVFTAFTWSQYARHVDFSDYKFLVDWYGNLGWTSAILKLLIGVTIDMASIKLTKKGFTMTNSKYIVTLIFILCGLCIAAIMNGLQLLSSFEGSFGIIILMNSFQAFVYPMAAMFIKTGFPIGFFGRLIGIVNVTMGLTSSLVIGLAEVPKQWPENGFDGIFGSFLVLMVILSCFPLFCLHQALKNHKKSSNMMIEN